MLVVTFIHHRLQGKSKAFIPYISKESISFGYTLLILMKISSYLLRVKTYPSGKHGSSFDLLVRVAYLF
jgi:hypothetical protein